MPVDLDARGWAVLDHLDDVRMGEWVTFTEAWEAVPYGTTAGSLTVTIDDLLEHGLIARGWRITEAGKRALREREG